MSFIQNGPTFSNPFEETHFQKSLQWLLKDKKNKSTIEEDLKKFSQRIVHEIDRWGQEADAHPPVHIPYSPYGERIDEIKVHEAWEKLDALSAEEGLIQLGYDESNKESGRLHQFLKLFLFHPSSAFYSCPLAMTDGAAKLIQKSSLFHQGEKEEKLLKEAFDHITSRDPDKFWTSGQWMTEKTGGSDVGESETVALKKGDHYELHGTKWFTSATTSQMCFTLARIEGSTKGSRGLSLFFVKLHDDKGRLNQMEVRRLKDKLGTHALPTAEIDLKGTPAHLIGKPGEGVRNISHLFNVTRIYNAVTTVGSFSRLLCLAFDYAQKRVAFGKNLLHHPLHKRTLDEASLAFHDCFLLTFETVKLLQREEELEFKGEHDEEVSKLLRLLTPLAKLYSAKINMQWTSELIESFGGAGYIEDTGLPRFLRDSQVFCIWEGTTNILSLDCLRAIHKDDSLTLFLKDIHKRMEKINNKEAKEMIHMEIERIKSIVSQCQKDETLWQYYARDLSFIICETLIICLREEFQA